MKLIVGLGNPGREYENTRHNIGFMVLDNYARVNNFEITKKKFNGLYEKVKIDSQDVIFLKPLSYMNLSGEVVKAFVDYFKINIDDINKDMFNNYLYTANMPDPDLIIRPSGEQRLSNFLLWQCAYSEFWYSNVCWPDFTELDLQKAIYDYQNRDRRFGGV